MALAWNALRKTVAAGELEFGKLYKCHILSPYLLAAALCEIVK